ncbi:aminodeoxychorismate/anthranilate synthase component II [Ignavibacteriales bacterium]
MKILVIDNYDSFTYNLVQLIGKFEQDIIVKRNDEITIEEIGEINPDRILISPGPGQPENSGVSLRVISELGTNTPVLGVCLGHQAIGMQFGARVVHAPKLMHGKTSTITHDNKGIFRGLEQNFTATRYHSLIIEEKSIPESLVVTASSEDGIVMGVRHRENPIEGIQFHPESILTLAGEMIIKNWLERR